MPSESLQTTVATPATITGAGLHTGNDVTLTVKPAGAGTGYVFKRMDLPDEPTVRAHINHVIEVERATTLSEGSVKIQTVEHLLSSLRGTGIDNALIEIDANEPPIGDGSAMHFMEMLKKAGRTELQERRKAFELREAIRIEGKEGAYMIAWPGDKFEVTCTNANHLGLHTQFRRFSPDEHDYAEHISKARTFVFYEEVKPLMDKGLIKGGSLENAVVIRGEAIMGKEPLRYPDEFVRHKILDVIADLALFPIPLKASIYTSKPSHGLNVQMARAIYQQYQKTMANMMPVEHIPSGDTGMGIEEIMQVLPHRFPFLLVDRILQFDGNARITGQKAVTMNEPFFPGHFPGKPVMPGVLQVEAMAQVASILFLKTSQGVGRLGYFMSADKVKFRKPVAPGDVLTIEVEMLKARGRIGKAMGQCLVNGETVSEGELTFAFADA